MTEQEKNIRKARIATVFLDDDGILKVCQYDHVDASLEDLVEINNYSLALCGGKKVPVLNDIRGIKSVEREARQFPSHPDVVRLSKACALLVSSPVSRVIGNFFLGFNKPPYPVKLFSSEEKALEWLKNFLKEE